MRTPAIRPWLSMSLLTLGCGAAAPEPEAPAAAAPTPAKAEPAAPASTEPAAAVPAAEPAPVAAPTPEPVSKPSRLPIDTIAAPKVAYVLNYGSSRVSEVAEAKCTAEAEGDGAAKAACLEKARAEVGADVVRFTRDKQEKLWWLTYQRKKGTLVALHKTPVELTETENTVTVKILGEDKDPRVLFAQKKSFVVSVPNDYSLEIDDPRLGRLVYDAKVDLLGD